MPTPYQDRDPPRAPDRILAPTSGLPELAVDTACSAPLAVDATGLLDDDNHDNKKQ